MHRQSFAHSFVMKFGQFVFAAGLAATIAGAASVCAQTPSASVRGGSTRVSRGGPLASAASFNAIGNVFSNITGLKPKDVRGNDPVASTLRVQRSWGGASAPASRNFFNDQDKSQTQVAAAMPPADDTQVFELLYENFRRTYRLGPADEIAIRVRLEPDYSIERAKISPDGRVFHPLLGEVLVAGLTVEQLMKKLAQDLRRYIKEPEVSVQLLEAKSAKIGVLGEVARPGILVMSEPLTVLDAITMSGGFARTGSRNNVSLVRQGRDGRYHEHKIDVKKLLAGKADVEENLPLQPGDTVIVHGNFLKKLEYVTTLSGFTQFLTFVALTR
jgi:protein involved in polysaccharide export with SLBB domain